MDKIKVAILDEDIDYSKRLMNYLNGKHGEEIYAIAFSEKDQLLREVAQYGFDYVVTEQTEDIGAIPIIRICGEKEENGFYRYGSARKLVQKLTAPADKEKEHLTHSSELLVVYSISSMEKRTEYAWRKAKGVNGIYFGMEEYCGFQEEEYWMEELLFLIRNRADSICEQIEEHLILKDGVRYLPSARCFLDFRYLTFEDYNWFFRLMSDYMKCPIIVDLGIGNFSDFSFFSIFDDFFLITSKSERGKRKETIFLNLVSQEVENFHEKIHFISEEEIYEG